MKKTLFSLLLLTVISTATSSAQSFKDLLNSSVVKDVVGSVTEDLIPLSKTQMEGDWKYQSFASRFESDDLLKKAGGAAVSSQINGQLNAMGQKIGINSSTITFNFTSGEEFSSTILGMKISGTYTLNADTKEVELSYKVANSFKLVTLKTQVSVVGSSLFLYFSADKLLSLLSSAASITQIQTLKTISSLADSYDGLLLGFELTK